MARLLIAIFAALLTCNPAWAAITFDTATSSEGSSSTSHSHTVAADANIVIVCLAIRDSGGAVAAATGVTVGGAAASLVTGGAITNAGNVVRTEMWYKLAPSTGSVTVAATGNGNTDFMVTGVMSFKGVAQTSTFNTAKTAEANTTNVDVNTISSALGEMGVFCGTARDGTAAAADATSPVSTERYEDGHSGDNLMGVGYTEDGAASSIDMRVDVTGTSQYAAVAVSMRPLTGRAGNGSVPMILN